MYAVTQQDKRSEAFEYLKEDIENAIKKCIGRLDTPVEKVNYEVFIRESMGTFSMRDVVWPDDTGE